MVTKIPATVLTTKSCVSCLALLLSLKLLKPAAYTFSARRIFTICMTTRASMGMQAFGWLMFVRVEVTGQARRPLSGCKPWVQQPELRKRKSISAVKSLPHIVFLSVHFFLRRV
jgi:hypothetical protein